MGNRGVEVGSTGEVVTVEEAAAVAVVAESCRGDSGDAADA